MGSPPVDRFTPDIDVYPQHFCAEREANGRLLVCNSDGVLEFDSERWKLFKLPNREAARSMAKGPDGAIYLGGYNLFGILRRDAAGSLQFEDLSIHFKDRIQGRDLAEVWATIATPEGIFFRSLYDVFFWDPAAKKGVHWHHEGRFGLLARAGGRVWLQFRGEGIRTYEAGQWRLMPETRRFSTLLQVLQPLDDSATLVVDDLGKWFKLNANGVPESLPVPRTVTEGTSFTQSVRLSTGDVVLGTIAGELFFMDAGLKRQHKLVLDPGFVGSLSELPGVGLLATVQGTLYKVVWPPQWSVAGAEQGITGNYYALVDWKGHQHLLTSSGIYRGEPGAGGAKFVRLPGFHDSPVHLLPLDGHRALLAGSKRLSLLDGGQMRDLSGDDVYPREIIRSRFHPGIAFVATDFGLRTLALNGSFKLSPAVPRDSPPGVASLVEVSAHEIWVGTYRHGVLRCKVEQGALGACEGFGASQGLLTGPLPEAFPSETGGGGWIVSTREGFFRWDGRQFVADTMGNLAALRQPEETFVFVAMPNGDSWAYSNTRIFRRKGNAAWMQEEVRPLLRGALVHHNLLPDNQIAFLTSSGLLIGHSVPQRAAQDAVKLQMTAVQVVYADGTKLALPLEPATPPEIPEGAFNLRFEFALPELVRANIKKYQGKLTGEDDSFSEWATPSQYTYFNLRPRDLEMRLRARDSEGRIHEAPPYRLVVVPPWYGRTWAKTAFAVAALAGLGLLMLAFARYRTDRLRRANVQLEDKVSERTRELAEAIQRLDMMAHMDGLTGVANRRRLDEYLQAVWDQCREQQRPLSVLVIDADHFKRYNDEHGHVGGDDLLKNLTRHLLGQLRRAEDFLARYGGEEFVVILPGADCPVAATMAEAMRKSIAESPLGITVSIGTCTQVPDGGTPEALVARADRALYEAKNAGRNQVKVCADC